MAEQRRRPAAAGELGPRGGAERLGACGVAVVIGGIVRAGASRAGVQADRDRGRQLGVDARRGVGDGRAGRSAVFYWFLKWVALGPLLRLVFRPQAEGAENVPDEGPAILASNHLSYADWLFMPLTLAAAGDLRGQGGVLHHARASRAGSRRSSSPAPARCRSTAPAPTPPRAR